jgi:hypothetical protein
MEGAEGAITDRKFVGENKWRNTTPIFNIVFQSSATQSGYIDTQNNTNVDDVELNHYLCSDFLMVEKWITILEK